MAKLVLDLIHSCSLKPEEGEKNDFNDWTALANVLKISSGIHVIIDDKPIFLEELSRGMVIWQSIDFWLYVVHLELRFEQSKKRGRGTMYSPTEYLFAVLPSLIFQMVSLGVEEKSLGIFVKRLSQKYDIQQEQINKLESICTECMKRNKSKDKEKEKELSQVLSISETPSPISFKGPSHQAKKTKFSFRKKKGKRDNSGLSTMEDY